MHERTDIPTDAAFHWAPSSFDLSGDFTYLPHPWNARWPMLEDTLVETQPRAVLSLLPATLGMGPVFLSALKHTKMLGMALLLGNPDVADQLLRQLGADFLIATPQSALKFFAELPAATLSIKHLYLVVDKKTVQLAVPYRMHIIRDLHEMPAVSIGV